MSSEYGDYGGNENYEYAEGYEEEPGFNWLLWGGLGCCCLLLIVVSIIVLVMMSRGSSTTSEEEETQAATRSATEESGNAEETGSAEEVAPALPAPLPESEDEASTAVVLDCESEEAKAKAKTYYETKGQWKGTYVMTPQVSNKVDDSTCDIKYKFDPVPGKKGGSGIDYRRFKYKLNPLDVETMLPYQSGKSAANLGDTIYDCNDPAILKEVQRYYNVDSKLKGMFTVEPKGGAAVDSLNNKKCDVKYKYTAINASTTGDDWRRFTFEKNNDNEWKVTDMGGNKSGVRAENL